MELRRKRIKFNLQMPFGAVFLIKRCADYAEFKIKAWDLVRAKEKRGEKAKKCLKWSVPNKIFKGTVFLLFARAESRNANWDRDSSLCLCTKDWFSCHSLTRPSLRFSPFSPVLLHFSHTSLVALCQLCRRGTLHTPLLIIQHMCSTDLL